MKILIATFLTILLLSSCYKNPELPPPAIPQQKMADILADIHLVEALLTEIVPGDKKDSLAQFYYQQVYFIHDVSGEDIEQSMEIYYQDPFILDSLYTKVVRKLENDKTLYVPKPKKGK
ncbi:MAG: DUF4296 domain-containing protein [Aureispira sp.]|nr:DUF4296 domain-containing protein [Aureispira sp.]